MSRVLVIYASTDGQTRRVAQRIAEGLIALGHAVNVRPADAPSVPHDIDEHDAVIVGGGIRYGHYPRYLYGVVRDCARALAARPNAFFSVCLSGGGPGAKPQVADGYVDEFCVKTGWEPREVAIFGGALLYRRYNPFIRFMMRLIVGMAGGDTDTSRDYEYTDWDAVARFARSVSDRLTSASPLLTAAA